MMTSEIEPRIDLSGSCSCPSDIARCTPQSVVVVLPGGESDVGILKTVIAEEKRLGHSLPVDSLIALVLLRQLRRLDTVRLAKEIQRGEDAARRVLERLVEAGLGSPRQITYRPTVAPTLRGGDGGRLWRPFPRHGVSGLLSLSRKSDR